jgi:hypothetical protein
MKAPSRVHLLASLPLALSLAACGGGDSDVPAAAEPSQAGGPRAQTLALIEPARAAAAAATAQSDSNDCAAARPFYWEVGDRDGRVVSGSVQSPFSNTRYTSGTLMNIASASKWVYAAFVAQRNGGALSATDRKFLSMRSGYASLTNCPRKSTVDGCLAYGTNGQYTAANDGVFKYDGGHMEKHASLIGLGPMGSSSLVTAVMDALGSEFKILYSQPQLAGGIVTTPDSYASFLRKMLSGNLHMGELLGTDPVCTNPFTCGRSQALYAPVPPDESWHYSAGHWVEDDPEVGDGAFSSPGAFGFYPWIDAQRASYGIVARSAPDGAFGSAKCGRLIRKAWVTGAAR